MGGQNWEYNYPLIIYQKKKIDNPKLLNNQKIYKTTKIFV